ncbi:PHP domain-containing protein [Dactylosporangium matsuzakiense]|nr:PHP domain-containing protein [Dactylosporangium matsuzakiense]
MGAWYRGDCHVHSAVSTGADLTPEQVVAEARAAGLDFIAVTEHNTDSTYEHFQAVAGDLLVLRGQEHTTPDGHWLEIEGGLHIGAHPFAPYPTGTLRRPWDDFDLIEVWNGLWTSDRPWNADNEAALAAWTRRLDQGIRQPAVGCSDTHLTGQVGVPHTVVWAEERTAAALAAGLRAGHSWIAAGPGVELSRADRRPRHAVRGPGGDMIALTSLFNLA